MADFSTVVVQAVQQVVRVNSTIPGSLASFGFNSGTGSPEGVVTATVSSVYRQTDGANGGVLWVKGSGSGNTGWQLVPNNAMGVSGVGGTDFALLARLILGAATASGDDSALIIARVMVGSLAGANPFSAHAFRDETTVNSSVDNATYASSDAAPTLSGTTHYGHVHGHQSRTKFSGSSILDEMVGFSENADITAGTVTNRYGNKVNNPTGAGVITNNFGYYCDFLDRGSTKNFAFYSTGPTKNSFGASLNLGTTLRTGLVETPDTSVGVLVSNVDLTSTAQAGVNSGATASAAALNFWGMITKAAAATAALVNAYGLNILTATKTSGSVATNYGLKIEDQSIGSSNNYSIFTGIGKLFFGDMVYGIRFRNRSVNNAASPYTVVLEDTSILATANAGAVTILLPTASGTQGRTITIKKSDTSANVVTITANGADTIDGVNSQVLTLGYETLTVQSDGTATWYIIG